MKLNIEITKKGTGFFTDDETIVKIDVNNGNWKYWEDSQEGHEKTSLTINNICKSHYIHLPVKDAYGFHDHDLYNETGEIQVKSASVRTYDSLLDYLNYRINNVKEDVKSGTWKLLNYDENGRIFNATLFKEVRGNNDVCEDITYELDGEIEVLIKVVE